MFIYVSHTSSSSTSSSFILIDPQWKDSWKPNQHWKAHKAIKCIWRCPDLWLN